MDQYDDISAGPDENGCLNIAMCAWESLPQEDIFSYRSTLLKLDVSHNQLRSLPKGFGCLEMLQELDISHNELTRLDNLCELKRLRRLNASHNKIVEIPFNIGECRLLEKLACNHNQITNVSENIASLFVLEVLNVHNNQIKIIPGLISEIPTLKEITCNENEGLLSIPSSMREDTKSILWCLSWQLRLEKECEENHQSYRTTAKRAENAVAMKIYNEENIDKISEEISKLKSNPDITAYIEVSEKKAGIIKKLRKPFKKAVEKCRSSNSARVHSETKS